ncbi:Sterol-sensing domain and Patched family-containing protein [Strongyloides ratti]|uniref:Sterol-sensing domain and Patched family-containing protein n=1 Tax=Strongyloides ratti TaxID=34506 RepID=A0A090L5Q5_STRRB|nr:Sterol-sensing domain and Patched family-containing protein [Strongyloides ratti]CEF65052.1 Sterol-sensing domain and Patched family-containing protein [Strongyloides ratti]
MMEEKNTSGGRDSPDPVQLASEINEDGMHTLCVGVTDRPAISPNHSPKMELKETLSNASSTFPLPPSHISVTAKNAANKLSSAASQDPRRRVTGRAFPERRRGSLLVGQRSLDLMAEKGNLEGNQRFVKFIIKQYKSWGYYVAEYDWQMVVICIIISLLGMLKIFLTPQLNDITGYSPYGARGRLEYSTYQEFFSHDGLSVAVYLYIEAKDKGTMLRQNLLKETVDILDITSGNITMYNSVSNKTYSFNEFCDSFCNINEPVRHFYNGFMIQSEAATNGEPLNDRIKLSYPISMLFGRKVSLQPYFFGLDFVNETVSNQSTNENLEETTIAPIDDNNDDSNNNKTLKDNKNKDLIKNNITTTTIQSTTSLKVTTKKESLSNKNEKREKRLTEDELRKVTNIKSLKLISFQFRAAHQKDWIDSDVKAYEMAIVKYFKETYKSDNLIVHVYSQSYVEEEMVRGGTSLLPYLTIGFVIMCACSIISVMIRAYYMHQCSPVKVMLAICACIIPFMACATALAILFLCQMRFASILCVIPFLALSIGVDSSYLMIHEWQRVTKHCREAPSRRNSTVSYRMAEVLSEVGPAIMISALTNIFADLVGCFTGSPEITLLCLGNLTTMFVMFIYQMTFYTGLMCLVGRYEIKQERVERAQIAKENRSHGVVGGRHNTLNRQNSKFYETTKHAVSESMQAYVNFVTHKVVAGLTILIYFIFIALAIWGITKIRINLSTQKLFALDSPLIVLDDLRVKHVIPYYMQATIFVNKPGNLSHVNEMKKVNQLVRDMEGLNGSWGAIGTQYFMRDFITFEKSFEEDGEDESESSNFAIDGISQPSTSMNDQDYAKVYKSEDLPTFVRWPEYDFWSGFIKISNNSLTNKTNLDKFFFTASFHGEENSIWVVRGETLRSWRNIVDKYKDIDAHVFHEDGVFLDLINNMPTDTWQSVVGTMVCMSFVCFVFLNSFFTVFMSSSCVLSISVGILGILSWWDIDLDPITMAAMIISIGFSVDIPAHVSYHYYQACLQEGEDSTPEVRLANCLGSVAFPAIQAGVSTSLCVMSLIFPKLYMAEVFVKTMIITVILCNLHGLVFLPAFLTVFDRLISSLKNRKKKHQIGNGDKETSEMKWHPKTVESGNKGKIPNK